MNDFSKMSDEELLALVNGNSSQPAPQGQAPQQSAPGVSNTQDFSKMSDQELMAMISQNESQVPQQAPTNYGILDKINALGGGIANGLVKGVGAVGGLATDLAQQTGIISPETSASVRQFGNAIAPIAGADTIPGQAMAANPNTAAIGDVVGQTLPYAAGGVGAKLGGNLALGALGGAANSEDGLLNRALGGAVGAGITGALTGVATAASRGIDALKSSGVVKKVGDFVKNEVTKLNESITGNTAEIGAKSASNMYNMTRDIDNEMFNTFRAAQGNFKAELKPVVRGLEDLADNFESTLSGPQKQVLTKAQEILGQDQSIAGLHDVRKLLAKGRANFGNQAGTVAADEYSALQKTVDTQMEAVAGKAGVLDQYKNANSHYKDKLLPLINSGTDDVASALANASKDPKAAGKILDTWVDKNIKPNRPNETRAFLETLDPVGKQAVQLRAMENALGKVTNSSSPGAAFRKEISKLGSTADVLFEGQNKTVLDGAMKILNNSKWLTDNAPERGTFTGITSNLVLGPVKLLMNSKPGQFLLELAGHPSTSKEMLSQILNKGAAIMGGSIAGSLSSPEELVIDREPVQTIGIRN